MKTKLASVLGLAVLMACFICGSSFVYADDVLEAASTAMQTLAPDANANGVESVDKLPCESSCVGTENATGDAQITEAGQSPSAVSETETSTVEEAPAIRSADAVIAEVTQTVTIVVPGEDAADSEEPAITGSIQEPVAAEPVVEAAATEASPAPATDDAIVVEIAQTVTIAAPGQDAGDSEAPPVAASNPEPSEPALTLETELP
jgi:hypothetical protein